VATVIWIPGLSHSDIQFKIQILMLTNVTGSGQCDGHLKSADFFNAAINPTLTFVSTKLDKVEFVKQV
jgi:polyisoprenoid-binding protein YceI